ncbi:hypothetical protein ACFFGR_09300 [Arthrobacter liuii]|uniref:Terminase small subunit n=1 Tax=Arthrobacter liuii TaxID=1476996 RepID=A0ABQ2AP74_9MICC|nr:hypothetical protein [Arthrobacter liuii]GGH93820.1 hypothetical protein GCM10007170_15580 [Arthrobacter liuii]
MSDTEEPCPKCGKEHPWCSAHTRAGEPCMHTRIDPGATVCYRHGGAAERTKRAAQERENRRIVAELYEADPQAVIAAYGVEGVADPLETLSRLAASAEHTMEALGQRVNALSEIRYENDKGGEQIRGEVKLYMAAMAQTGKFLEILIKSGFEERKLKLDEQTAQLFVTAMQRVLGRLDLTPEQTALVGVVVPETLRELGGN